MKDIIEEKINWNYEFYKCIPDLELTLWELVALSCNLSPEKDVKRVDAYGVSGGIYCLDLETEKRELFDLRFQIALACLGKTLKANHIVTDMENIFFRALNEGHYSFDSRIKAKEFVRWAIEDVKWINLHSKFLEIGGYSDENNTTILTNDQNQRVLSVNEKRIIWQQEANLIIQGYKNKGQMLPNKEFISSQVLENLKQNNPESIKKEDGELYPTSTIKRNIKFN
jgi:hypothetical protein